MSDFPSRIFEKIKKFLSHSILPCRVLWDSEKILAVQNTHEYLTFLFGTFDKHTFVSLPKGKLNNELMFVESVLFWINTLSFI